MRGTALVRRDLAQQVEAADGVAARILAGRIDRNFGQHAEHQRTFGPDAEKLSDRHMRFIAIGRARRPQPDRRLRAVDGEDASERRSDRSPRAALQGFANHVVSSQRAARARDRWTASPNPMASTAALMRRAGR